MINQASEKQQKQHLSVVVIHLPRFRLKCMLSPSASSSVNLVGSSSLMVASAFASTIFITVLTSATGSSRSHLANSVADHQRFAMQRGGSFLVRSFAESMPNSSIQVIYIYIYIYIHCRRELSPCVRCCSDTTE